MSHKTSRFFKAIIMFIVVNLIFLTSICSFETNQDVKVSIKVKPKIDIVLAKSRTKTDVTNFEKDLLEALKKQNIDTDDVRISAVQAEQVDMTKNFAWKQDLSSSIGNISIVNNGQSVTMNGNSSNPGKNAIWIMPNKQNQDQKFTFSYNIDFGDSFNAAGMLLKVKEENNTLTGYMLSFNNSSWNNDSGGYNGAIWEFSYGIGQNSVNMTKTLKQGLSINNSGTLTVTTTDTEITIEGGGLSSKVVYTQEKEFGNGYGFFSDHYSHGCDSIGSFTLQNINLETTDAKTFDEVLRQTSWRKSSYRFLVNVTDRINNELLEASTYGELTTRLMNDNIYFVSWGNDSNKEQFTNLILQNDNKGLFIDNSDYSNSINLTAIYIREILEKIKSSEYIIVNEPVNISVDPESAKNNTADEEWPYGKWKVIHDYEYYENNMGQFANSGKYVPDFISSFDKTGRYEITYEDKDITPKYVYVHRKPVASFIMKLANGNVSLQSNSYDLDNISNNNGISEEEWQWRTSDQTTWTTGKLTNYDADKTYIIKLRVKDFQNTWSEPTAKFIYNGSDTRPIAMFNIKEDTITKYEKLGVEDQSYDPSGKKLTTYLWEIYKGQELKYSGDTIPTSFLDYELGEYTLYLTVTNSNNTQSERVSRTFTVIDDTIAPEVVVTPVESDWVTSINVKLSFSDRGGSEFKQYKYAITDSQSEPSQWSETIAEKESNILIDQEGSNKYLHIIAEDNAGNVSEDRIVGPYKIDKTGPDIKTDVDLDTVTTGNVKLVINATDNLSGLRKITINGEEYVNGSEYEIVRNGNYDIVATDNIGNSSKKRLVVNNINRVCNEGLNHPNFASSYDECPICALLKNIKITNEKFVYDSMEHRVEYDNPDNVSIKEYYNNDTNIPVKAGDYNYKLKVIYDGNEYDTHFTGTLKINKKDITITNITATNRQYNGTNVIKLKGGELQGIEDVDQGKVGFVLSATGTVNSKNVGQYYVQIPEIVLNGAESNNYKLKQPDANAVKVEISQKDITITNITTTNRQYNGTNIVELQGGELQGIEEIDKAKVGFTLSKTGTVESKNVGQYYVQIPEIVLNGAESNNYKLKQPDAKAVKVEISQKDITITNIAATNRQYNGTNVVELQGGELQGIEEIDKAKVGFTLSKTGTVNSKNVGQYYVQIPEIVLTGEECNNYKLKQPDKEDVSVEISQKDITITKITATSRQYNGTNIVELQGGELQGIEEIDKAKVGFTLSKTGTVESKNIGQYYVQIPKIVLTGEECNNYKLKQPDKEDVSVEISQKDITITKITATSRQYNGTNIVELQGGELQGIEEIDKAKVGFILSKTGTVESKNIGQYYVQIPEITLVGRESYNYKLKQPDKEDVSVEISKKDITIKNIKAVDKLYDKNNIVKIQGGELIGVLYGEDVSFKLPETGISESEKIGSWNVKIEDISLTGVDKDNYNLIQPEIGEIKVTILEPNVPALYLETKVEEINGKENKQTGDVVRVSSNDVVKVLIKVKNKGVGAGYAQKVKIKLPDNVEMAQEETNEKYKWTQDDKNTILTDILCFENGEENEIPEKTEEGVEDTGKTLEVYLKIKDLDRKYQDIELELNVTQTDINNKVIEDKVSSTTSKLILRSNYAKNQIEEKIYSVNDVIQRDEKESNNETEVEQRDIVVYNIRIYNHGEIDSYASKIIDYPENGLEFLQQNEINQKYGWVMLDKDGEVTGNINNAVKFQSQYLSDKKIPADSSEKTSYEDIQIAFKVSDFREKNKKLENVVKIEECKDQYDNVVENIATEKDNTIIKVKYFDLALRQNINRIQVYENGKLTKDNSLNNPGMFKVEIKQKNIEQTVVKVCYDIFVTNEGEIPGYAKEIKDIIPSGFEAKQEENEQWVINDNGELVTNQLENTLINPGETKKVTVTLTWKNAEGGLGVFENIAEISKDYNLSETLDVDSLPNNNDKNEDDYSSQKGIISIATGVVKNIIGLLIIVIFALVLLNILIRIKRKDSSCNH